jgi:hypothetical protein
LQPRRVRERKGGEHQYRHDGARNQAESQNSLFHRLILLIGFQISGAKITAAAGSVVILSGEFKLSSSKSYFGVRAKAQAIGHRGMETQRIHNR